MTDFVVCVVSLMYSGCSKQNRNPMQPLPAAALARLGSNHLAIGSSPHTFAFSADGTALLSGPPSILWDAASGESIRCFQDSWGVFSSCGRFIATVSDTRVEIFSREAPGAPRSSFKLSARGGALSKDAALFAVQTDDNVSVWDTLKKKELYTLSKSKGPLCFSPDGTSLAIAGSGLHDAQTGKRLLRLGAGLCSLAFSPDSKRLYTYSEKGVLFLWDLASGKKLVEKKVEHTAKGSSPSQYVACSRESVVTWGADQLTQIWSVDLDTLRRSLPQCYRVALAPDGALLFASSAVPQRYNKDGEQIAEEPRVFAGGQVTLSKDGRLAVTSSGYFSAVWSLPKGEPLYTHPYLTLWAAETDFFAYSSDRKEMKRFASVAELPKSTEMDMPFGVEATSRDGSLWLIRRDGLRCISPEGERWVAATVRGSGRRAMLLSGDESRVFDVFSGRPERVVNVYAMKDGAAISVIKIASGLDKLLAVSQDGALVLFSNEAGDKVIVADALTGAQRAKLNCRGVSAAQFSRDGKWLFLGDLWGQLWVASLDPLRICSSHTGHIAEIQQMGLSADGALLFTSSSDLTAILWKTAALREAK
jgi:WD40 repeat protein